MQISGMNLTRIGQYECLLEPTASLNIAESDQLIPVLLTYLGQEKVSWLYYDLSSYEVIDSVNLAWLEKAAAAVRVINASLIAVSIQPTAAYAMTRYMHRFPEFETALSIQAWRDRQKFLINE